MSPLRIGIVGMGRTGWRNHAMVLQQMPEAYSLAVVSDIQSERAREAAATFACRAAESFDDMIADPNLDVVVIASPSHLHCEQAVAALRAGKHVVCEKPMAVDLPSSDKIIAEAREANRILTVFHTHHFANDFRTIRDICASGIIGRVICVKVRWNFFGRRWDWQTLKKFGGGSLNNTGAHALEQALHFFENCQPALFCDLKQTVSAGDAEDYVKIILTHPAKPTVDIEISPVCAYPGPKWSVWGTRGGISGSATELRCRYFLEDALPERIVDESPTADRSYNSEVIPWQPEKVYPVESKAGEISAAFYRAFFDAVRNQSPFPITPEHARRVMELISQCRSAAMNLSRTNNSPSAAL